MHKFRTDETAFRTNVPRTISGVTLLEVIGYQSGTEGNYGYAYALGWNGDAFSTHMIYCQDDATTLTWVLHAGHYDIRRRSAAWLDLIFRADRGLVCTCCIENECECAGSKLQAE